MSALRTPKANQQLLPWRQQQGRDSAQLNFVVLPTSPEQTSIQSASIKGGGNKVPRPLCTALRTSPRLAMLSILLHKSGGFETVEAAVHNAISLCPNAVRTVRAVKLIKAPITVGLYRWALGAAP